MNVELAAFFAAVIVVGGVFGLLVHIAIRNVRRGLLLLAFITLVAVSWWPPYFLVRQVEVNYRGAGIWDNAERNRGLNEGDLDVVLSKENHVISYIGHNWNLKRTAVASESKRRVQVGHPYRNGETVDAAVVVAVPVLLAEYALIVFITAFLLHFWRHKDDNRREQELLQRISNLELRLKSRSIAQSDPSPPGATS